MEFIRSDPTKAAQTLMDAIALHRNEIHRHQIRVQAARQLSHTHRDAYYHIRESAYYSIEQHLRIINRLVRALALVMPHSSIVLTKEEYEQYKNLYGKAECDE